MSQSAKSCIALLEGKKVCVCAMYTVYVQRAQSEGPASNVMGRRAMEDKYIVRWLVCYNKPSQCFR